MMLSFFEFLEGELEARGFYRPANKQPVMSRNFRNMFHRMSMSEQDVRTMRGMIVRLIEGPREPQTRKRTGPKQTPSGTRSQDFVAAAKARPSPAVKEARRGKNKWSRRGEDKGGVNPEGTDEDAS